MPCNPNINRAVDRNLTTTEDLGTKSITSVVEEVLIGGGRKNSGRTGNSDLRDSPAS